MKKQNQKGITLIALIITVIVMLILVGVSISVALNTGLFKAAQGVAKNTQIARDEETAITNGTINIGGENINIDDYISKLSLIPSRLNVGDIIEYTPASSYTSSTKYSVPVEYAGCTGSFYTDMGETIEWKIIGIEGKTIKIIPNAVSSDSLTIDGANGWNNFIDALDNVCGIVYGNTTSEYYTATARSLTVEDINDITRYKPASPEIYYAENFAQGENYFPIAYLEERGVKNITEETSGCGYAANSSIKVEHTYYAYETEKEKGFNTKFANWINLGKSYWLASPCVESDGELAYFYIWFISHYGYVDVCDLFGSDLNISVHSIPVRPVVSLTPIVAPTLEKTVEEGDVAINYWKFE